MIWPAHRGIEAMSGRANSTLIASCRCGSVVLEATGAPIGSVVCYCDDCQAGARQIEALPDAGPVKDPDGGTAYVIYRKDRVSCSQGAALLKAYKIRESSATNRVVATCCNSAIVLNFDDRKHWVDVYRSRMQGDVPPLQMRICTKFRPGNGDVPRDVPSHRGYPFGFLVKLVGVWFAMALHR
jgi:hypothetical protein